MRMIVAAAAVLLATGCSGQPPERAPDRTAVPVPAEKPMTFPPRAGGGRPVAGLPYAKGRTFTSLDEYLAHLQRLGAQDIPYYAEVQPGVYETVVAFPTGVAPQRYTRAELARKFGFPE